MCRAVRAIVLVLAVALTFVSATRFVETSAHRGLHTERHAGERMTKLPRAATVPREHVDRPYLSALGTLAATDDIATPLLLDRSLLIPPRA